MSDTMIEMALANGCPSLVADSLIKELASLGINATISAPSYNIMGLTVSGCLSNTAIMDLLAGTMENAGFDPATFSVVPSASDTSTAYLYFDEYSEIASATLEDAGLVEISAMAEEIDEEDEPAFDVDEEEVHVKDENDKDEDEEEEEEHTKGMTEMEDDGSEEDDGALAILGTPEATKIVSRLYGMSCGDDLKNYPNFWRKLDQFCSDFRKKTGYNPEEEEEEEENHEEVEMSAFLALAAESKFREGRSGFLSSFMRASSGDMADKVVAAWDAKDVDKMQSVLETITKKVLDDLAKFADKKG